MPENGGIRLKAHEVHQGERRTAKRRCSTPAGDEGETADLPVQRRKGESRRRRRGYGYVEEGVAVVVPASPSSAPPASVVAFGQAAAGRQHQGGC